MVYKITTSVLVNCDRILLDRCTQLIAIHIKTEKISVHEVFENT